MGRFKLKCPKCSVKVAEKSYTKHLENAHGIKPRVVMWKTKSGALRYRFYDTLPKKHQDAYDTGKRLPGAGFSKK